jgi:phosphoribosylformimino-5-aminoimidazole carboxamide ribotide isomerase
MFEVIPAVDLRAGRCVRLFQGDFARETVYSDDPVAVAQKWEQLGAPRLHIVDLDGAKLGHRVNHRVMAAICDGVSIPVEVSGGIRDLEGIEFAFGYGADLVQLGSIAALHPEIVRDAVQRFGARVVVAIDALEGEVRTNGWIEGSGLRAVDLARSMADFGVTTIMFTDIGRDATMTEPNYAALADMVRAVPSCHVVASGGVAHVDHLVRIAEAGCSGAIVGKALYEGTVDLQEAIAAVRRFADAT